MDYILVLCQKLVFQVVSPLQMKGLLKTQTLQKTLILQSIQVPQSKHRIEYQWKANRLQLFKLISRIEFVLKVLIRQLTRFCQAYKFVNSKRPQISIYNRSLLSQLFLESHTRVGFKKIRLTLIISQDQRVRIRSRFYGRISQKITRRKSLSSF